MMHTKIAFVVLLMLALAAACTAQVMSFSNEESFAAADAADVFAPMDDANFRQVSDHEPYGDAEAVFEDVIMAESEAESEATVKCVTANGLNVRSTASTGGRILRTLPQGSRVSVESTSNGWSKIGSGQYVSAQYLGACSGGGGGGGGSTAGSFDCGMSYVSGSATGNVRCVKIDGKPVTTGTADAFQRMKSAAASAGVRLSINSGFRTMAEQQYFYNCYLTKRCNNGNLAAKPGYSNHQNGKALDLNTSGGAYQWLVNNGQRYGFVRTVPSETWHWELRPGSRCNAFVSYSCR